MHPTNFRNPILNEPRVFGGQYSLNTPAGVVTTSSQPPPLPPRPLLQSGGGIGGAYGSSAFGNRFGMSSYGYSGFGGGYGGFGSYGGGMGYGGGYGGGMYGNGYGMGANVYPEHRFIQLAEESSRPAFQNIESLVGAIGNIAAMLDSTFFALTSSFRAVLGVAANFAHLRGVFAQFWTSFALFRWIIWAYRKILYWLRITKTDPATASFKEAFKIAEADKQAVVQKKGSSMPVVLFLGFIMSAPYLLMKLFGGNSENADAAKNPRNWTGALEAVAIYNFDASSPNELTIRAGQPVLIAPKTVQVEQNLLNTGWVLASVDNTVSGLIPVNYVQGSKQQQQQPVANEVKLHSSETGQLETEA